ncbi:MAG: response regulator transcription factor [Lachnospiraceae bacterium]|nr:response regulator transcription factor [Lachnospiraceae bacterium]
MSVLVYIVEDDNNIREIEAFALKNSGYQVEEFFCGKDFLKRMETKKPDLVLLDVMLPDEDGLSILKKIRKKASTSQIPVIFVTAKTTEMDKVKGFDIGADDYLTKPFGIMELISRVKAVLRRTKCLQEEKELILGNITMNLERRVVYIDNKALELTYKEFELCKFFMENIGVVLQRESIMAKVWGVDFEGESRTLDMHIKTLRHKLGEEGKHIKTVRNVGYRME